MKKHFAALALLASFVSSALAQTTITDAWVRGTVPGQKATGAFMQIVSEHGGRLVQADSPVAAAVEIHEMTMEGNVMKMRAIPGLALPAGETVELKPGGYHIMMMGLKRPVQEGETLPITLVVEGKEGKRESVELQVPVRALTAAMPGGHGAGGQDSGDHGGGGHGKHRH
ncbi:MAG: copper chaperone PCu(A)C [Burkholderiaceae bacterium]